jgi:hypothetical protein
MKGRPIRQIQATLQIKGASDRGEKEWIVVERHLAMDGAREVDHRDGKN